MWDIGDISQHNKVDESHSQHYLNRDNRKAFQPSQEQDKDVHSFHTYSTVLEVLARERRQVKEIKEIQMGKREVNIPLFTDYQYDSRHKKQKDSTRKLLHLVNAFRKIKIQNYHTKTGSLFIYK